MKPVLVDSSVWIDFLRQKSALASELSAYLQVGTAALCPVIWFELVTGFKGKRELAALEELKSLCIWLEIDAEVWEEATILGRKAKQSGLNCPMADILIAGCAKKHGAMLIHRDKHFDRLMEL